jgi:hypothetical protein
MTQYATKLIDLIERSPNEIAKQWYRDVKKNPRTPTFHNISEHDLIPVAVEFYGKFREMFFAEQPWDTAKKIFGKYAEDRYKQGIPLEEAIYALILMRRHIWLYAEFQALFVSAVEQQQAAESLNRTILMFDYAIHVITEKYQSLIRADVEKRLGGMKMIIEKPVETYQYVVVGACILAAVFLTYLSHARMQSGVLFTHLFYIPIVLASVWFRKKGIIVAVLLAALVLISHFLFLGNIPFWADLIRAGMFIFVSITVSRLTEGLVKAGSMFKVPEQGELQAATGK